MIISLNGPAGSGKSTVAKVLAEKIGWPSYHIGALRRHKARQRGLTLAEYNKLGESDPNTDLEVDEYQKELGEKNDNFIIEGRTSWHFIPHSVKFYLDVDPKVGARRVLKDLERSDDRNEDRGLEGLDDVLASHRARMKSDNYRYKKYFNIKVHDKDNYDHVIDTSHKSIEEIVNIILQTIGRSLTQ